MPAEHGWPTIRCATVGGMRRSLPHLPGLGLALGTSLLAFGVARWLPAAISPLVLTIVIGILLGNLVTVPERVEPGLAVAAKHLLRIGVVLLGLQLPLTDVIGLGPGLIGVVVAVVVLGVFVTNLLGRALGVPRQQRLLIACGFSICGAAAVAAADAVLDSDEEEVVTAVALVVLFGSLMIAVVPLLGTLLGLAAEQEGAWAGAAIHEVAQVVAAGAAVGGGALTIAVVVKLARVLMLAPVLGVLTSLQRRHDAAAGGPRPPVVPLFVAGFIAMAVLRSTGVLSVDVLGVASSVQTVLLAAAMFALGTGVRLARIRRVGGRPFALAALSTVFVTGVGLSGVLLLG